MPASRCKWWRRATSDEVRPPATRRPGLPDAIALLTVILIGVIGYKLSPMLLPQADITVTPEAGCDLHRQACAAQLPDGGRMELSILPQPIPMVATLQVEVRTTGFAASRVEVDFAGVDMNMGLNRFVLAPTGPGRFGAEAALPVCVTGNMQWQATALLDGGRSRVAIPFRFGSQPH